MIQLMAVIDLMMLVIISGFLYFQFMYHRGKK